MPGMGGGVLSPEDARRLMSVLQEMTEYVDGEDLGAISAQKPIYETGGEDRGAGAMEMGPPDMGGGEEEEPKVDVDALIFKQEGPGGRPGMDEEPHSMLHKGMGRPGRLDRRR